MSMFAKLVELYGERFAREVAEMDEAALKSQLSPLLRGSVVDHLRKGKGPVAASFRGESINRGLGHYDTYLAKQAKDGTWGTAIEGAASGELFDAHVAVTYVTKGGRRQEPFGLYRAEKDTAPTVHLYNSDNVHFYVDPSRPSQTYGGNNCFYHSLGLELQKQVRKELGLKDKRHSEPSVASQGFFNHHENVIEHQRSIERSIKKLHTPSELVVQEAAEKQRISKLNHATRRQIERDYKLALKLASEEREFAYRR